MFKTIVRISLGMLVGAFTLAGLTLAGCSRGDTSSPGNNSGPGTQFVSDGGAGATLSIEVVGGNRLATGSTTGFFVRASDPSGAPLEFINIFCNSELGIAIIEPSNAGVAFELTDSSGSMSGVIGALLPGSFVLQCEADNGFGLRDRVSIVNEGDVPVGFAGFPGAAGGTLNTGGGVIVDETGSQTVAINSLTVTDAGGAGFLLDTERGLCFSGGEGDNCTVEPFSVTTFQATLSNGTTQRVVSATATFTVVGAGASAGPFGYNLILPPGGEGTIEGLLTDGTTFATTGDAVVAGTYDLRVTVRFTFENGSTSSATTTRSITWSNFNRCPDGTFPVSVADCTP